jgi:molecular chaperone GrpE (heat shock protein)
MSNKQLRQRLDETNARLNIANRNIKDMMDFIDILSRQLAQQDKAIERKDKMFEALKMLYKDDLINNLLDK